MPLNALSFIIISIISCSLSRLRSAFPFGLTPPLLASALSLSTHTSCMYICIHIYIVRVCLSDSCGAASRLSLSSCSYAFLSAPPFHSPQHDSRVVSRVWVVSLLWCAIRPLPPLAAFSLLWRALYTPFYATPYRRTHSLARVRVMCLFFSLPCYTLVCVGSFFTVFQARRKDERVCRQSM